MGQKANPIGLRLGIIKGWDSNWYGGKNFCDKLVENQQIRTIFKERLAERTLGIYRWWFDLHHADVFVFSQKHNKFILIDEEYLNNEVKD